MQSLFKRGVRWLAVLAAVLVPSMAMATDPDATVIVTTATTVFGTVAALTITVVTFFVVVRIVKWIRR